MSKSKKQDVPPPRPEAAALPLRRLTEAQRKAGKAVAAMLQRMANEPVPSAFVPVEEHPYLPLLHGRRSNRVLLIDGGRGTGKSTLVVTLLNGYGQRVLGQESVEPFEEMDDRIIPIGIVDLQPLPPQTNLALHIVSHLKRVVEAVDPRPTVTPDNTPPLWDEQALGKLRESWQRLMRLLATWDESLEARLGQSDMSAYVVETIEEELERGQLPERFLNAVDLLVEGYARRFRWSGRRKPLFLLAIDDADMNPRLSVKLLELLRKLWHPRLAFLVAGDSDLFLLRLREELNAHVSKEGRDQEHYRRLAQDIYAKDIPSSARFQLDSLLPEERVKRILEINKLLSQYIVEAHAPELPRKHPERPLSLRDYLLVNKQSAELLPERLRQIDELTARLREKMPIEERNGTSSSAAFRVIKWLWDQTVEEHFEDDDNLRQLSDALRSSRLDGQLRLDLQRVRLRSELEPVEKILVDGSGRSITLHDLDRFQAFGNREHYSLDSDSGSVELEAPVTACWLLAMDVAADAVQGSRLGETAMPFSEGSLHFVVASWRMPDSNDVLAMPWMLPAWKAPVDYVLFARAWRDLLNSGQPRREQDVGLLARQFLWLAIQIARSRTVPSQGAAWWEAVPDWPALTEELAGLAELSDVASPRQQLNARWALEEAVLITAPESCLPIEEARSFLDALMRRLGSLLLVNKIQERRIARVVQTNRSRSDREGLVEDIDASHPSHPFMQAWKQRAREQRNRRGDVTDLWNSIASLEVPQLKSVMRTQKDENKLIHYGTDLRQRALGNLPRVLSSTARQEVERYQRISTSAVLVGLWKSFAEKLERPDMKDWFSVSRTDIIVSKDGLGFGKSLRESILSGREGAAQIIKLDELRTLCIERFAPISRSSEEMPPVLDALFRLVFDYAQDQDDASALPAELLELSPWPVISTRLGSEPKHPLRAWPAVRWPSLKEYEDVVRRWAETVQSLHEWINLDKAEYKPYVADALAFSYLRYCETSRLRTAGNFSFEGNAKEGNFSEWLTRIAQNSKTQAGRRDKLFSRWIESLPLMGTPEAALSDPIAEVFINHALSTGMDQARLRELRRECMRAEGLPTGQVEELLAQIDQSFREHPWVTRVEGGGPSEGGATSRKKPRS